MGFAVTTFYAGLCALIFIQLAFRVIRRRRGAKISLSDGGDAELLRLTRAHSHAAGLPFVIGRFLHARHFATERTDFRLRVLGMHLTIWPLAALAIGGVAHGFVSMM